MPSPPDHRGSGRATRFVGARSDGQLWTEAHRARHEPRLKAVVAGGPPWGPVYGWFRRWLALGLFDALLREVARRRRRKGGRRYGPTLGIIDTQVMKCVAVRGPRGYG